MTAVNFDYRGFDTARRRIYHFLSRLWVQWYCLVRHRKSEKSRLPERHRSRATMFPASDSIRLWILVMVAPRCLFGIYVVTHGQLTPGGGFQGGVILASCALIIYVGENFEVFKRILSHPMVEAVKEAAQACLFSLECWPGSGEVRFLPILCRLENRTS